MVQDEETLKEPTGYLVCDDRAPSEMSEERRRELFTPEDEEWIREMLKSEAAR